MDLGVLLRCAQDWQTVEGFYSKVAEEDLRFSANCEYYLRGYGATADRVALTIDFNLV